MLSDEEAEKLSKIMYGDKPNSKIEAPDEDEEKKKRDAYYEKLQSVMYDKTGNQTQGKQLAEQSGAFLDGIKDRDTLMQYYDAYSQDLNQSIQNKDTVNAYKNQYLLNKVADKLGKEANVATYLSDLGGEIKGNILENVAGKINFVAGTYADRGENTIDANSLYKIATSSDGKYKNASEQRNYDMVINLLNSHPDDKNIVELASLVQSGNFKGEKEKIKLLTDYANSVTKTEEFQKFEQAHTADEKRYLENLKRKEALSNYGTLPQLGLNAVGTVANMAPDIGLAYGTGAALGIKNNNVIGNITKVGMGATKAGSQLSDTLSQGNDFSKSMEFSILSGLNEYVWESIGGDFVNAAISGGINATPAGKVIQGLLDNGNVKSNIAKAVILHAAGVNEEGFEEVFTDLTDAFLRSQILSDNSDWENIGESLVNSYVQSILPTLLLGGFGQVQVNREISTQEKVIKNAINVSDFLSTQQKDELIKGVETAAKSAKMGLTDNWTKAKKEVYNSLSEAQKNSLEKGLFNDKRRNDILNFAKNLDETDKAIKEREIINHAREMGISEASLRQMFGGEELVFPYSYSQARETVERLNTAQTSVQSQLNQQAARAAIGTVLNVNAQPAPQSFTIRHPDNFSGTEYDWLKQYFKEENRNGVSRIRLDQNLEGIKSKEIFGSFKETPKKKLNNSPVAVQISSNTSYDGEVDDNIEIGFFVYQNLKDAVKDLTAQYDGETLDGALSRLEYGTSGGIEIFSLLGNGAYTVDYNLGSSAEYPIKGWLKPRQGTQEPLVGKTAETSATEQSQPTQQPQQPTNDEQTTQEQPEETTPQPAGDEQTTQEQPGETADTSVEETEPTVESEQKDSLSELEEKFGTKRETRNGIDVVELPPDTDVYSGIRSQGQAKDITQDELNNSPVYFTVHGKNSGKTYTYVYKNKNDMLKDWNKTYGGLSQIIGTGKDKSTYTIMSASGKGEFYLVRDKYSLGGWKWIDANGEDVNGYKLNKRIQTRNEEYERNNKIFEDIENKYGTKQTETINGKTITYINIDKQGKRSPYWQYFWFDSPLTTNDGKQDDTINTRDLDWRPIVAIVFERGYRTAKAFRYVHDLKLWLKEHGGTNNKNFTIARNTSGSSYSLAIEDGEFVWRSDFDGRRVKPEFGKTIVEEAQGKFKTALKNPSKHIRHIDFRGKTFSDAAEFANVMQPAIDPLGETLRVVFTKKEGNRERILGVEETSYNTNSSTNNTNYPNRVGNFLDDYGDFIARKAKALGADYVYEMHNHPGSSHPSGSYGVSDDLGSSTDFKKAINRGMQIEGYNFKYGGGLVNGYNGYSFYGGGNRTGFKSTTKKVGAYTRRGGITNKDEFVEVPYTNGYKYDGFVDEPWTKTQTSLTTLKELADQIPTETGYSKVILSGINRKPMYVGNIRNDALLQSPHKVNALLYELSRNYGGGRADVYSNNKDVLNNLKKKGMLVHTIDGIGTEYLKSPNKYIAYYEPRNESNTKSYVKWYTPKDEVVDDEDFIARNIVAEASEKKEPLKRIEKKTKSLTDIYNEKKNNPFKRTETSKSVEKSEDVLMDLIPTDMEKGNSGIEQAIREIESGTKERELGRARTSLATIYRYINKVMNGRTGKLRGPEARKAYGIWKGKTHWIRAREKSNVSTWFHELGHEINDTVLNMTALKKAFGSYVGLENELNTLCEKAFGKIYNKKPDTKLQEGFAEAVREFIENPEKFAATNPAISKLFADMSATSEGFADMMVHMKALSEMSKNYINDTPEGRVMSNIDMQNEGSEKVYHDNWITRGVTKIVENFFNDLVYGTKFDRQVAKLQGIKYRDMLSSQKLEDLMRTKGNADAILRQLARGYYDDYGNKLTYGLTEIIEGVMPTKEQAKAKGMSLQDARVERMNELAAYGVALRELTLLTTRAKKGEDFKVGQRINDLKETIKKYRADAQLNEAMSKINDNSKAIINIAVNEGLISATVGKQILEDNILYFPLNRVMEDRVTSALGLSKDGSTGKSFYRLKGSDLQIQNPLISLMGNWGRILYNIDYNNMLKTMVRTAYDVGNLGDWFDIKVSPKMEYRGTVSLDVFKNAIKDDLSTTTKALGMNLPVDGIVDSMNLDAMYSLFVPAKSDPGEMMLTYLDNGVRKTIQFANNELGRGLYNTITSLDTKNSQLWLNIMNKLNQPLRLGATVWNIEFALSNIQSDAIQRFLYSSGNAFYIPIATSVWNVARYINSRYGDKLPWGTEAGAEMYEKFMRSKASQSGTFRGDQVWLRDNAKEVFGYTEQQLFGKKRISSAGEFVENFEKKFGSVAEKLGYVSEVSEQATRFAEFCMVYKQMKARGFTEAEAVREAGMKARQVTQDFTTQGKLMREINKLIPFASATAGGLYRFGQEIRNQPVRLTVRLSALLALAAILEGLMDGEDREYYEEINKQKRFDNFFFKNPAGDKQHPIIIKKPQGPARYLINFVQLITNASLGRIPEDKVVDELYDWLAMSVEDQLPATRAEDFLPTVLKAMVENSVNKDFYYGNPIVPKDLEKLDPKNQYDEYTSELAKAVGNVFNWSPLKVDNVLKTWFAGAGKRVLDTADSIIRGSKENQEASLDISEKFGTSKMFGNAFRSSESVNEVYDRVEELEREEAEGRLTDEEERELANLKEAQSALTQINKKIKAVNSNPKLSADEKREEIDTLREQRTDAARYYLGKTPLNASNVSYIETLSFYPSSSSYTYSVGSGKAKKKYTFEVTDEMQEEYAAYFKKEYERELATLKNTSAYQRSTEQEKLELEKKTKSSARTSATNYMKKKAAAQKLGQ